MSDDASAESGMDAGQTRQSPRMGVNVPAQLLVRGRSYSITIRNISRFGAFVIDLPTIERGAKVTLQIRSQGPTPIKIAGAVVYWIDNAAATRLGNVPGAGLRFDVPIDLHDTWFGAAITCLIVKQSLERASAPRRRADKPTPRILEPVEAALREAMNAETSESTGKLVFAGLLAVITVPELLMTLARLQICGRLELTCGGIVANIDLQAGDVVAIRSSTDTGDARELIGTLLASRTGTFRLLSETPHVHPVARMKVAHLLIEHAQKHDVVLPEIPDLPPKSGAGRESDWSQPHPSQP